MNNNLNKQSIRLALIAAAGFALATSAWAKKFALTAAHAVPAAAGTVDTHLDKNGNTDVDIKVHHLAHPANLTPPATTYVVWFRQPGSAPQNEGELKVDAKLEVELKTETQWKSFELMITAENNPATESPSGDQVLSTRIQG